MIFPEYAMQWFWLNWHCPWCIENKDNETAYWENGHYMISLGK